MVYTLIPVTFCCQAQSQVTEWLQKLVVCIVTATPGYVHSKDTTCIDYHHPVQHIFMIQLVTIFILVCSLVDTLLETLVVLKFCNFSISRIIHRFSQMVNAKNCISKGILKMDTFGGIHFDDARCVRSHYLIVKLHLQKTCRFIICCPSLTMKIYKNKTH